MKMDEARRAFVSDCASRFVNEFLGEQLLFHSKGKAKKKIRVGEIVVRHSNSKLLLIQ